MIYIIFAPVSFLSSPKTGGMKDTACLLPLHYRMGRGDLQEGRKKAIIPLADGVGIIFCNQSRL
jgi:hypothetical protein